MSDILHFESPDALREVVGVKLGPSPWVTVSQDMINAFASATGDDQWIHVDSERARREMPNGKTIAHGYLLMSMIARKEFVPYSVAAKQVVNYGINRMRFLSPVHVGARIRAFRIIKSVEQSTGGVRVTKQVTIETDCSDKPALVGDILFLYYP